MMRLVRIIFGKEVRDHARDRRSLVSALAFPLIGPLTIAMVMTLLASWESTSRPLEIAMVGQDRAPNLAAFLLRSGAHLSTAPADYEAKVKSGELDVVLVVPEDFGKDFLAGRPATVQVVEDGSNNRTRRSIERTKSLLRLYGHEIGAMRLLARGVDPELAVAISPDEVDLSTKQQQAATLLNMIPIFLLMGAFIGGMHVAIDAMAGERERGSLEPLLVNPVPPSAVVLGKWMATTVYALVGVLVMLAGTAAAVHRAPLEELGLKVTFGMHEEMLLLAVTAPLLLFTSALQMLVATFARSFKEAQTYVTLVVFVPMLPGMFLSLSPIKPQAWMHAVPTLSQDLLMTDVMRGDPVSSVALIVAALSACVAAAICLVITSRLLVQEKIVFGR
ncbi:MAG: ABC transporter permease [Deltaproteobacteria bacterium]|nr:ABC transporter permease [Deltaproteobacteria bacterium]